MLIQKIRFVNSQMFIECLKLVSNIQHSEIVTGQNFKYEMTATSLAFL